MTIPSDNSYSPPDITITKSPPAMMGGDLASDTASMALQTSSAAQRQTAEASAAQQQLADASAAQKQASAAQAQASGAQQQDSGAQQQASSALQQASAAQFLPGTTIPVFLTPKLDVSYYPRGPFGPWVTSDTLAYAINPQGAMRDLCPPGFKVATNASGNFCAPSLASADGKCPTGWTFNPKLNNCVVSMAGLPLNDPSLTSSGAIQIANLPKGTIDVSGAVDFTKLIPLDTEGMVRQMYFMLLESHRDRRFMNGLHSRDGSSGATDSGAQDGDRDDKRRGKGKGQDNSQLTGMITTINGKIDALIQALTNVSDTTKATDDTVTAISNTTKATDDTVSTISTKVSSLGENANNANTANTANTANNANNANNAQEGGRRKTRRKHRA